MANVARYMAESLRELGVKYIFGVPSGSWTDFMEGIRLTEGIEFVLVSNEAAGGIMADVCWRLTGQVATCFGTYGPGACNLSTGVCCAHLDRSPMVALADEMPDALLPRITQMNINNAALFRPLTKHQTRLQENHVKSTIFSAFKAAVSEVPGPVYIGLPRGIGSKEAAPEEVSIPKPTTIPAPPAADLEKMTVLFQKARMPVIALGITSIRAGIKDRILAIAENFQVPIILTPMAKGMVPDDHPLYAGVLAHAQADIVARTHQQADLVVGIGYDPVEINYEDWIPNVPLLHIDTIPADLDQTNFSIGCDVVGDLHISLDKLASIPADQKDWDITALKQRRLEMNRCLAPEPDKFDARTVLSLLRQKLPPDGTMTCDVGAHLHLIGQAWPTQHPASQIMTNGCSTMGFGIPAAIASALCRPDQETACVTGDGGFLMMAGEMATAKRLGCKIVFVLMSDQSLSLIKIKQERKNYANYGTALGSADSWLGETCFGVPVLQAADTKEYQNTLDEAFAAEGPVIIEVSIDPDDYEGLILT